MKKNRKALMKEILTAARNIVECGEEQEVQVSYSVGDVDDCDRPTNAQQQRMARGIGRALDSAGLAACSDDNCPEYSVVSGQLLGSNCTPDGDGRNIWTTTWDFVIKCVP